MKLILGFIIPDIDRPESILTAFSICLRKHSAIFQKLSTYEAKKILEYFSMSLLKMRQIPGFKSKCMQLPLYESVDGCLYSMGNMFGRWYTVPNIITTQIKWNTKNGNLYLKNHSSLKEFYAFVEVEHLTIEDAYLYHIIILDWFALLDSDTRHKHLTFLKDWIQQNEYQDKIKEIISKLHLVPIIKDVHGIPLTASTYYDPSILLFAKIEKAFPTDPYDDPQWCYFLREIGLICKIC